MHRRPLVRALACLVVPALASACGETFVSGSGATATGAGGATSTGAGGATSTGAGGSVTSPTGSGGASTGSGGATTGAGGAVTSTGGGGGTTATGSGGGGGTTSGSGGAGGSGGTSDAGAPSCPPVCPDADETCDPVLGQCVVAGWVRVLRATAGSLCVYSGKWAPIAPARPVPAGPSSYLPLPPGQQHLLAVDDADCPHPLTVAQKARAQPVLLAAGAFHTLVDIPAGTALFADDQPTGVGATRVRYVDVAPAFVDAPLDFSAAGNEAPPVRLQSGGLLALGVGKDGPGYQDLPDDRRPSPTNPIVFTTDAPHFHFLANPIPLAGQRLTAYAGDAPGGQVVLLCADGSSTSTCHLLTRAGKDGAGNCDPRSGAAAPWTCLSCGQSVHGGSYTCEGGVTNDYWKIVQEPACACRPGVPTWNHCVMGANTSCQALCKQLGRSCAPKCVVQGVCVGTDKASFDNESWPEQGTVCEGMSTDCSVGPKYCTNAYNGYCCCE